MSLELIKEAVVSVNVTGATAAQTAVTSAAAVDMDGFLACTFIATLSTVVDASVLTLTVYESATNATSGGTAITGAVAGPFTASTSSNTTIAVDVIRPSKRYLYCTLTRTAQNATVGQILAIQYRASNIPTTQPATMIASALSTPEV